MSDTFVHNSRSELVEAQVNNKDYEYTFDNIGNRQSALEGNDATMYDTNALNQYTAISENGAAAFVPQFDADGNQTLIKTETGIWTVVYNAENRPVSFTNNDSNTVVECAYDSMGRRAYKKVTTNGSVTLHQRYLYRGYLQIACIDLTRTAHPCLWLITWDSTQPIATRPLAIQKDGTWYTYGLDLTKNVCEVFGSTGYISTTYTYSPYGSVTSIGNIEQPIQWSSEVWDKEIELMYYNYRYYNTVYGRWCNRDSREEKSWKCRYSFCNNNALYVMDYLGEVIWIPVAVLALAVGSLSSCSSNNAKTTHNTPNVAPVVQHKLSYNNIEKWRENCGRYKWVIAWKITPFLSNGVVSQSVTKYGYISDCEKKQLINIHYMEYWQIGQDPLLDEVSRIGSKDCGKGEITLTLVAKVTPNATIPNDAKRNTNSMAGLLAYTDDDRILSGGMTSQPLKRTVKVKWDCCEKVQLTEIINY